MPQQTNPFRKAPADYLNWLQYSAFIPGIVGAAVGTIGGFSGVMRTEYQAKLWEHPLILALILGGNGLVGGLSIGLVAVVFHWGCTCRRQSGGPVEHSDRG
jgi:hypothetical protein